VLTVLGGWANNWPKRVKPMPDFISEEQIERA